MALADQNDLAIYPPFVRKVTAAMVSAAVNVGAEAYDGTQYKLTRRALVTKVLEDSPLWGSRFAYAVASNPVIAVDSSDNDIQFTVNSMWDAMAGAHADAG